MEGVIHDSRGIGKTKTRKGFILMRFPGEMEFYVIMWPLDFFGPPKVGMRTIGSDLFPYSCVNT